MYEPTYTKKKNWTKAGEGTTKLYNTVVMLSEVLVRKITLKII